MFLGTRKIKATYRTMLAIFDNRSTSMMALMVHNKRPVKWAMNGTVKFIEDLGYGTVSISVKCDAEPSIIAVGDAITAMRSAPTIPLDTPVREAQANGSMDRAIKTLQGQCRTLLAHLVERVGSDVEDNFDMLQWLAHWVSVTLNRYKIHAHGKTAFQVATGHSCRRPITAFGESVLWKNSAKPGTRRDKGDSEFREGIYLGVTGRSIESIIGTPEGIVRAYSVRRVPQSQRWSMDDLHELNCPLPHSLHGPQEEEIDVAPADAPVAAEAPDRRSREDDVPAEEPPVPPADAPDDNDAMGYSPTSPAKSGTPSWLGDDMVATDEQEDTPSP